MVTRVATRRFGLVAVDRWPADEAVVRAVLVRVWYAALIHEHVFTGMPMRGLARRLGGHPRGRAGPRCGRS